MATWCAPCVEELPSLLAMHRELPDVAIVAVSIDQDEAIYRRFLTQHHVDLLTVRRRRPARQRALRHRADSETYIIDKNGILRRKFVSSQNWTSPRS